MRLSHYAGASMSEQGAALEHYVGNMAVAMSRSKADREIRQAHATAEAAIRMRSSFLENMNHELRTPLNAIIGFAGMLQNAEAYNLGSEQQSHYADYILQSADLLLGHINTILEVAALDNGSVQPTHAAISLSELLDKAIERATVQAKAAGVKVARIRSKADDQQSNHSVITYAWADEERLAQALDHLFRTAVKSCRTGNSIYARLVPGQDGWQEIQIRDDGEGFSDAEIDDALTAFGESHRGLGTPFSGPGVGLAIAKTFVEMQGGTFHVKSRPGKGTLSCVSFPPAKAETISTPTDDQFLLNQDKVDQDAPSLARTA